MIYLSRLNGEKFVVNAELIETVEANHDTVVTLTTGKKFVVLESTEEIIERVINYRRQIFHHLAGKANELKNNY